MTMNSHMALGIAQIIFYVPIVPLAIWLMTRNGKYHPRMAWWPMIPFSLMRLAGGGILVAFETSADTKPNIGLAIAAIVLLNVGAVPLIIAASGFLRIVVLDNYKPTRNMKRCTGLLRAGITFSVLLLSSGGALGGQADPDLKKIGRILGLVGYVLLLVVLGVIMGVAAFLYTKKASYIPSSTKVLRGLLLTAPFLLIRCIYGILQVIFQRNLESTWNSLYGSAVAFALMALLVEYIAVGLFFYVGFSIAPDRGAVSLGEEEDDPTSKA